MKILLKKLVILVSFFPLLISVSKAQGSDCVLAQPICGNTTLNYTPVGSGKDDFAPSANGKGCFSQREHNSSWYVIKVAKSGTLAFTLVPGKAGSDYDFGIWGPNTGCTSLGMPVRCNTAAPPGETGLSLTSDLTSQGPGAGSPWSKYMDVEAGQTYYLLIDNASNNGDSFTLNWSGTARLGEVVTTDFKVATKCTTMQLSASATSCNTTSFRYDWKVSNPSGKEVASLKDASRNVSFDLPFGSYQVELTTTSATGAVAVKTQSVVLTESVVADFKLSTACATVTATSTTQSCSAGSFVHNWQVLQKGKIIREINDGGKTVSFDLPSGQYEIRLNAIMPGGGASVKNMDIDMTAPDILISGELENEKGVLRGCFEGGESYRLTARVPNPVNGVKYSVTWTDASGRVIATGDTVHISHQDTYQAWLSYDACMTTRTFSVQNYCPAMLIMPTAFSPNGDGLNDRLHIRGRNCINIEVQVFNRWGELIYFHPADDSGIIEWDGSYNGQPAPGGVYACLVTYFDVARPGRPLSRRETITIIR